MCFSRCALQIAELGQTLLNMTNLVPNGFVVFLPSYAFLSLVKASWSKVESKVLERLQKKKVHALCRTRSCGCLFLTHPPHRCFTSRRRMRTWRVYSASFRLRRISLRRLGSLLLTIAGGSRSYSLKPYSGALLFAVVGAKLSEGLNFSDGLARAVAIVGLPFANLGSAELQARMKYVREHNTTQSGVDAGKELYENL